MKLAIAIAVAVCACDPQVDGSYGGDAMVRVRGVVIGFGPDDHVDGGAIRWNTQVGADLRDGPRTPVPAALVPPDGVELDVIDVPEAGVAFGFGDGVTIAEGHMLLVDGSALVGDAVDVALVYLDGDADAGTMTATYLGGPTTRGYHLCAILPTVDMSVAQTVLADACGGTPACASQRRYQLEPTSADLGADIRFFRTGP